MLEPIELRSYPSCRDCLSWSADGELAVAAGEIVYVLCPVQNTERKHHDQTSFRTAGPQWDIYKLKTNTFTLRELPLLLPEPGTAFSIGEEQSNSHAVSIAWSPPRVAVYRRCMLAVLTGNLALSLWQAKDGSSKWNRAAIVNHALRSYFKPLLGNDGALLRRKQRIRSFSWSHTLLPGAESEHGFGNVNTSLGMNFLIVSNDANDIIVLHIIEPAHDKSAVVKVLNHFAVSPSAFPLSRSSEQSSLFAETLANRTITTSIASGPWLRRPDHLQPSGIEVWALSVAFIHGSALKILNLEAAISSVPGEAKLLTVDFYDTLLSFQPSLHSLDIRGPLHWLLSGGQDNSIGLAAGIMNGFIVLDISKNTYAQGFLQGDFHKWSFDTDSMNWQPLSGFTSIRDNTDQGSSVLYVMTVSSLHCLKYPSMKIQVVQIPDSSEEGTFEQPVLLMKETERFKDRFNLDYDLCGMARAKSWGLCSYRGWIAASATIHPIDMAQHTTSSQERMMVFFAPPSGDRADHSEPAMPWHLPADTSEDIDAHMCSILRFTLEHQGEEFLNDPSSRSLLYAAACCVIVQPKLNTELLARAKEVMQTLAHQFDVNLAQELAYLDECDNIMPMAEPTTTSISQLRSIPPKSKSQLQADRDNIFERCNICSSGIEWFSPIESQCAEGHLFARCALTFISIQDPFISKRCSTCGKECLDNNSAKFSEKGSRGLFARILDTFDECPYCCGKFKA